MAALTNHPLALPAPGLDLGATLFCGQSFSWREDAPGVYTGVAGARCVQARMQGGSLLLAHPGGQPLTAEDAAFWHHYFALDVDYPALIDKFNTHKKLAACVAASPGIRVLHQPFFDTLLSFIISQNNHIPRISGIVQRLCEGYGAALAPGVYGFPTPDTLAALTPEALAPIRAGFRAKYLIDAAQKVQGGAVCEAELRHLPTAQVRQRLMTIYGVGAKVADCVLLYGLERAEVVPMDVWMKRAMQQTFPKGMPRAAKGAEGIAQQYIFYWARQNL